ncbi:SGNH/GDSL hydrolase family protein [Sanyastnella coralliicola]|uniref:SGNH/GDSL hydrolase family protein n=1 Tax=Sanyastnella coralliicola TaxID=3069118 RepID=UPI0027B8E45A|nr:SGNH/GDSL hydrolase family protein [Longitalea sp. SCSIO 12813]
MKHMFLIASTIILTVLAACQPTTVEPEISERAGVIPADSTIPHALTDQEGLIGQAPTSISYLALGDSYTIGESVASAERWPVQLQERLNAEQATYQIEYPDIVATTGWTTANLSNAMEEANVDSMSYDLVSLLIGVNNQYQGLPLAQYEEQYTDLLERAINIAGSPDRVFVVSIPDYGYTDFGVSNQESISEDLAQFNASCQSITESYNIAWYNITPISQQWPDVEGLVANDGLHPSGYQYGLWVDSFWEQVLGQLED